MKKLLLIFAILTSLYAQAQHIEPYTADKLMQRISNKDTLYIVNFWATWCVPCVHELPAFDTIQTYYAGKNVKVLLVSLDFKESYPSKIVSFINKKKVLPEVVWFKETDANAFIPKIDSSWDGSLPSTMIMQAGKGFKQFMERTITAGEIEAIADKLRAQ